MEILDLNLSNFRNFVTKKIAFDKNLTVVIGPNGSGKSNILEAIALLSAQKPLRVDTDLDLVKFGKDDAKIESKVISPTYAEASVDRQSGKKTLTINFQIIDERFVKKSYFIDGLKKRLVDFTAYISIIVFHPQDLDLVSGSPSLRRHHLDSVLSSLDRNYWRNVSAYSKIVVRRNRVLQRIQEGKSKPLELNFWDGRLVEHGNFISKRRQEFFEFVNFVESVEIAGPVGNALSLGHSLGRDQKSLRNLHGANNNQNSVIASSRATSPRKEEVSGYSWLLKQSLVTAEKLLNNRERDIAAGVTLSGPHRDDFRFLMGGRDLEFFGSRGEQRIAVLALKLAELEYFQKIKGERPILALDDIFSELDWQHRDAVLAVVGNQQTIITAAERESIPKNLLKKAKVVEL